MAQRSRWAWHGASKPKPRFAPSSHAAGEPRASEAGAGLTRRPSLRRAPGAARAPPRDPGTRGPVLPAPGCVSGIRLFKHADTRGAVTGEGRTSSGCAWGCEAHGCTGATGSPGSRGRRGPRSPTCGLAWPWWASRILALCSGHGVALSCDARPSAPGPRLGAVPPGRGGRVCVEPRPVPFDQQVLSKLELAVTVPRTPEGRKLVCLRPVLSPGLLAVLGPHPCRGGCRRGAPLAPQPGLWVLGVWALSASSPRAPAAGPPVACRARGPCRVPSAFNIQSWGGGGGASAPWDSLSKAVRFHSG